MNTSPKGSPVSPNINIEQALNLSRGSSSLLPSSPPTQGIDIRPNNSNNLNKNNISNSYNNKASGFSVGSPSSIWNMISRSSGRGRERATSFSASDSSLTSNRVNIQENKNVNVNSNENENNFSFLPPDSKRSVSLSREGNLKQSWRKGFIDDINNNKIDENDDITNFKRTSRSRSTSRRKSTLGSSLAGSGMVAAFGNHHNS